MSSRSRESPSRNSQSMSLKSQASSVETTVTKLLMSTKQLLQTLTQWSKGAINEKGVSDAYVQLGNDFKVVSKFFMHAGIDTSDLGNVPMDLRKVLEIALREEASEETLDKYLPRIREIIVNLLDKLKGKQALLKTSKADHSRSSLHSKSSSIVSTVSTLYIPSDNSGGYTGNSPEINRQQSKSSSSPNIEATALPKQTTLTEPDALSQLKNGTNLQRRASKRFSAYHIAKLTNQSTTEAMAAATLQPAFPSNINLQNEGVNPNSDIEPSSRRISSSPFQESSTNSPTGELTLFLKMENKIKKCKALHPLNMSKLRLLFVEKFAYSPKRDAFPDMYVQDPSYSVFYELEDTLVPDLVSGSVVELRTSQPKNTSTEASNIVDIVRAEISKSQDDILNHIREISIRSQATSMQTPNSSFVGTSVSNHENEIRAIKHQISVLRQVRNDDTHNIQETIRKILEKVKTFKSLSFNSTTSTNRVYMEKSQSNLGEVSDALLSKVDDLQDIIEVLRKDVAIHGAKPSKTKLELVYKELEKAQKDLADMENFISLEKPTWKKIWEAELDKVCEEQQFLSLQEDLALDLKEDLAKTFETYDLVRMCCEEQEKNPKKARSQPILPLPEPGTLNTVRDQLLVEVESLNPDHEGRVDALEKAQKLWEREKEYRDKDKFADELGQFVEGSNFKRSGGIGEVERLRRQKDEENLRATFGGPL